MKLVVSNVSSRAPKDEVLTYFRSVLSALKKKEEKDGTQTDKIKSFTDMVNPENKEVIYIIEFNSRDDLDICLQINGIDWMGQKLSVKHVKQYLSSLKKDAFAGQKKMNFDPNAPGIRLFIGNLPKAMTSQEVRGIVSEFGMLKSFNLVPDPQNKGQNKGFAFVEFYEGKAADRAITTLNGFDIGSKKLKVQRSAQQKTEGGPKRATGFKTYINDENRWIIPLFSMTPCRVIVLQNFIVPEDVIDDEDHHEIKKFAMKFSSEFGEILAMEIPRPDPETGVCSEGVGKVFIKFSSIVNAKQARLQLSGRSFRNRTIVASFYPEKYFDTHEYDVV